MTIYGVASLTLNGEAVALASDQVDFVESGFDNTGNVDSLGVVRTITKTGKQGSITAQLFATDPARLAELLEQTDVTICFVTHGGQAGTMTGAYCSDRGKTDLTSGKRSVTFEGNAKWI